jgi:hypothetical protein
VLTLSFNEPVRRIDGVELDYLNVDNLIFLRKESESGDDIPFNATISTDKKTIEVRPDNLLEGGTVYRISVADQFEDYSGNRLPAHSGTAFTTGLSTAVPEQFKEPEFKVFPNPGSGLYKVTTGFEGIVNAEVYSYLGVRVYESRSLHGPEFYIDLTTKSPGLYMLVLRSATGSVLSGRRLILSK